MTVKELIEQLQKITDPEVEVIFYGSGGKPGEVIESVDLETANNNGYCPINAYDTDGAYIDGIKEALEEVQRASQKKFDEIEAEGSAAVVYERGYTQGHLAAINTALEIYNDVTGKWHRN